MKRTCVIGITALFVVLGIALTADAGLLRAKTCPPETCDPKTCTPATWRLKMLAVDTCAPKRCGWPASKSCEPRSCPFPRRASRRPGRFERCLAARAP